ncbi:MAG: heme ABC transporter permease [Gammaproteobacteria bacterium]
MFKFLHKYASLMHFHRLSRRLAPWLAGLTAVLMAAGLYGGLVLAPADYQQGDSFRIIYVHVPSAWLSLFVYMAMAGAAVSVLVWKIKLSEIALRASAPLGASFTFLALVTGAIWGKPMWGTWWVWDARLTSELVLLFLYLGVMALMNAIEDRRVAARAASVLTLVGVVNIPIIHYSVEWWSTLHQGPTVSKLDQPSIHIDMLIPLLLMSAAFMSFYGTVALVRMRVEILRYDRNASWVRELVTAHALTGARSHA